MDRLLQVHCTFTKIIYEFQGLIWETKIVLDYWGSLRRQVVLEPCTFTFTNMCMYVPFVNLRDKNNFGVLIEG